MSCYNSAPFLDAAVASLVAQSMPEWELILVDDGSRDRTRDLCSAWAAKDSRVRLLFQSQNGGPSAARNAGMALARGEWIAILDSDDVAAPRRLERQLAAAAAGRHIVMVASDSISMDAAGTPLRVHRYPTRAAALQRRLRRYRAFPAHSSMLYRRSALDEPPFNERYRQSEDCDLWLRLSERGAIISVGEPLVFIRKHSSNISLEEGGVRQLRFGLACLVCHYLRLAGQADPSVASDEADWQRFLHWLDARIGDLVASRQAWADARAAYVGHGGGLPGTMRFATSLLASGHAFALLSEKLVGTSLPQRLAAQYSGAQPCAA